jgi:hypothetical protein
MTDPKEPFPDTPEDDSIGEADDAEEKIAIEEPIEPGDPDGQTT